MYRGEYVDIRYTENVVEIYHNHQRIASHPKFPDYVTNQYATNKDDMPDYFNQPEMNKERLCSWASTIGENTLEVINRIFGSVQIKEQGYNAALSVLNLSKHYSSERFEDACQIALTNTATPRYRYIKAILSSNQDLVLRDRKMRLSKKISSHQNQKVHLSEVLPIMKEVSMMINEETKHKLREMSMNPIIEALEN